MSHTKEPWAVHRHIARIIPAEHMNRPIGAHEDAAIDRETYAQEICAMHWPDRNRSEDEVRANARRIVACVNACAGYSTEDLEQFGRWISSGENPPPSAEDAKDAARWRHAAPLWYPSKEIADSVIDAARGEG
jgi:hypothetical protein